MTSGAFVDDEGILKRKRDDEQSLEDFHQPKHARLSEGGATATIEAPETEIADDRAELEQSSTQFFFASNNYVGVTQTSYWREFPNFQIIPAVWAERGVRRFMEDTHLICPSILKSVGSKVPSFDSSMDAAIFAIFDGHGGRQTASFARDRISHEIALQVVSVNEEFFSSVNNNTSSSSNSSIRSTNCEGLTPPRTGFIYTDKVVEVVLKRAFLALDARLDDPAMRTRDGCVAVVAFVPFNQAVPGGPCMYVASIGDAAALLARRKAVDTDLIGASQLNAIPINETHRPWVQSERARIYRKGGTVESGRVNGVLEVSRSFGDFPLKKFGVSVLPSVSKFRIDPELDHFILLGCDGFWSNWTAIESVNKVASLLLSAERRQEPLASNVTSLATGDDAARPLVELIQNVCKEAVEFVLVDKRTQDNVSLMILKFHGGTSTTPATESRVRRCTSQDSSGPTSSTVQVKHEEERVAGLIGPNGATCSPTSGGGACV